MVMKDRWMMPAGLRRASAMVAIVALAVGGAKVVDDNTLPGSGFSTVATVAAEPTGPPGPTGGMTDGGGSQFQPPQMPSSMPDYQGGNNQPPLDQNSGISIYNTGSPGVQQVPGQQGGQQPQQAQQPAHGTQIPDYQTATPYTQGPGKPNPDYQAPQQNSPQKPQQGNQGGQNQQPQQGNQNQQPQNRQDDTTRQLNDQQQQQSQQKCQAMQQDMAFDAAMQLYETMGQVGDVAQQIAQIAQMVLPKGGGGGLNPDGSRQPGRLPIMPSECAYCPPDSPPVPKPDPKPQPSPVMTPDVKPDNKPAPTQGNKPEPTKADEPKDKDSADSKIVDEACDLLQTTIGSYVCRGVRMLICMPSDPDCVGSVPICFAKETTTLTPELVAQRQQYIDLGNELIARNKALGGVVMRRIGRSADWADRSRREIEAAKKLNPGAYATGLVGGHGPDLVWEGTMVDNRPIFPMDSVLNGSIGSLASRYRWGYIVTEYVAGTWAKTSDGVLRCMGDVALK
ncbi:hypothetical protein [Mycobacteroides abscessus]|uniref:hypothetical protein n=1 Tax=Mycobacteroides abscessus TaxID=36809 RepID=UPI000E6890C7|nr:hypothetical protein D2E61_08115 [Mycobacteroides abscessus]